MAPAGRQLLVLTALMLLVPLIQLVPLPPSIWTALPGRAPVADGFRLLGQPLPWLPMSLAPARTVASLLWLLPALAVLLGYRPARQLPGVVDRLDDSDHRRALGRNRRDAARGRQRLALVFLHHHQFRGDGRLLLQREPSRHLAGRDHSLPGRALSQRPLPRSLGQEVIRPSRHPRRRGRSRARRHRHQLLAGRHRLDGSGRRRLRSAFDPRPPKAEIVAFVGWDRRPAAWSGPSAPFTPVRPPTISQAAARAATRRRATSRSGSAARRRATICRSVRASAPSRASIRPTRTRTGSPAST